MQGPDARPHAEPVVDTPSSTATVIRTPHRQSLADLTPSAWELFANGISFDNSESSNAGRYRGVPVPPPASAEDICTPVVGCSDKANSPGGVDAREIPLLQITTPGKTTIRLADLPAKTPTKVSFLDRRAQGNIDPGGRDTGNPDPPAGSRPGRSFSLLRRKTSFSPPQPRDLNPHDSADRDLATRRKRSKPLEATTRGTLADANIRTPAARSPLRRFMPLYGTFKMRRRDGSRNGRGSEEEVALSALHPVTNLGHVQKRRSLEQTRTLLAWKPAAIAQGLMGRSPASTRETQTGMLNAREQSNNTNQLELEACNNTQNQSGADDEKAIRDITNKGNEFAEECASTPITITTGSDHPTSSSKLAKRLEASPERRQRLAGKRQLSRVIYNLSDLGPPDRGPRVTGTNPSRNISPSATQRGLGEATDTTCINHPKATGQRNETLAARCPERTGTGEKQEATQCSTSHRSTYTPQSDSALGSGNCLNLDAVQETLQKDDYPALNLDETLPTARGGRPTDMRLDGSEERSLTLRVPGAFPAHLVAEDGTGDLFRGAATEEADTEEEARGSVWAAPKELWWTVQCHATALLSLYQEVVGPVFDSRSEYWMRNARNEATLADGFALALAVPGAILGTVMLV